MSEICSHVKNTHEIHFPTLQSCHVLNRNVDIHAVVLVSHKFESKCMKRIKGLILTCFEYVRLLYFFFFKPKL